MTVLTTGVLVVVLMVIGVGTSITGVHLERNALQHAADSAALAASQAVDEHALYTKGEGPLVLPASARAAAEQHLRDYPPRSEERRVGRAGRSVGASESDAKTDKSM